MNWVIYVGFSEQQSPCLFSVISTVRDIERDKKDYSVSKNDTALACYYFNVHQPILIIFGRSVAKKVSSQMLLYFPTSTNQCFCTTQRNRKPKIVSFYLNAESCFASRHRKHIHIITRSQLNCSSFTQESAVCTKQDLRSEYSMLSSVTTHSSLTKSVVMIAVSKAEVVPCRASAIFEKSPYLGRGLTDFDEIWHADAVRPS